MHVVLPGDVDDPTAPSGGNTYDRRVCEELPAHGWRLHRHLVDGAWPRPDDAAAAGLRWVLDGLPDGAVVLVDGLVGCGVPEVVVPAARRLRLAVLVHLPLAEETGLDPGEAAELERREREVLDAAAAVVVTGPWAARRLGGRAAVHVVEPGVDPAPLSPGRGDGSGLLCLASVTRRKAQDVLVRALAEVADRPFDCVLAGPRPDPAFDAELTGLIDRVGLTGRVRLVGPLTGADLEVAWAATDLAVLVSWAETYGMVVTEALARGLPVVVSDAGALPETLGRAPDGGLPGAVVPAGRVAPLAEALACWFDRPEFRVEVRGSAAARRCILSAWADTARHLHAVLDGMWRRPVAAP
ncbi:glycosyltransferase family 4 protein [Pseudonocardia sp. S2-4]|uniref:Glycosyltransferase family 4 protein n=1 Tax=Pseudonocardia humida TaxID=2800819 RepID=A0ABT0ZUM1_9PSEU|nr:glycosyltransferase family 4 protein [Pseudonocardia humida]